MIYNLEVFYMQKSTFEQFKHIFEDKIKDMSSKSVQFLSSFFNKMDDKLAITLQTLKEQQQRLNDYIQRYIYVQKEISTKQQLIQQLQSQIDLLSQQQDDAEINALRTQLSQMIDRHVEQQQQYLKLLEKIRQFEEKISTLTAEKHAVELERIHLRNQYNTAIQKLNSHRTKLAKLNDTLHTMQQREQHLQILIQQTTSKVEIEKYEAELAAVKQAYVETTTDKEALIETIEQHEQQEKELQQALLEKVSVIGQLTKQLSETTQQVQLEKDEKAKRLYELMTVEQQLVEQNEQLKHAEQQLQQLIDEKQQLQLEIKHHQNDLQTALELSVEKEQELHQNKRLAEQKIQSLSVQLLDAQNDIAIAKAKASESHALSDEDVQLLDQKIKPRFQHLYANCTFEELFFKDLLQLIPSEQIKVEKAIAEIAYQYDLMQAKLRPHPIKTATRTFLEYPFSANHAGRIYFIRTGNQFQFFRLSRAKNGAGRLTQQNVIAWLQKNY